MHLQASPNPRASARAAATMAASSRDRTAEFQSTVR